MPFRHCGRSRPEITERSQTETGDNGCGMCTTCVGRIDTTDPGQGQRLLRLLSILSNFGLSAGAPTLLAGLSPRG